MKRREFILIPVKTRAVRAVLSGRRAIPAPAEDRVRCPCASLPRPKPRSFRRLLSESSPPTIAGPERPRQESVIYIDRQLASPYGRDARRYTKGPWIESIPEHGYQGKETPQQVYRAGIGLLGADFAGVSPEQQDLLLKRSNRHTSFSYCVRTRWKACFAIHCMAATSVWPAGS